MGRWVLEGVRTILKAPFLYTLCSQKWHPPQATPKEVSIVRYLHSQMSFPNRVARQVSCPSFQMHPYPEYPCTPVALAQLCGPYNMFGTCLIMWIYLEIYFMIYSHWCMMLEQHRTLTSMTLSRLVQACLFFLYDTLLAHLSVWKGSASIWTWVYLPT